MIRNRRRSKNRSVSAHTGGGSNSPGTADTLLLDVQPRMQAQKCQVYQTGGQTHLQDNKGGHAGKVRSTAVIQEG